jgi:hypothetical protein
VERIFYFNYCKDFHGTSLEKKTKRMQIISQITLKHHPVSVKIKEKKTCASSTKN